MVRLSNEHLYFDALWVKAMRTLISPELVWTSYNVAVSLCYVLWNVTSLSLSRISSFKRNCKLLTGGSTCLYDLWITWSLKYNIWRSSQTDFSLYNFCNKKNTLTRSTNFDARLVTVNLFIEITSTSFLTKINNVFSLKSIWSKLVSTRSNVVSLPL